MVSREEKSPSDIRRAELTWEKTRLVGQRMAPTLGILGAIVFIAVFFFAIVSRMPSIRVGDGSEYYALQIAWSHTQRPYMTESSWELYEALQATSSVEGLVSRETLESAFPALRLGATADFNHFWMYPALATLVQRAAAVLGIELSSHESFLALHGLLFAIVLLLVVMWHGSRGAIAWIALSLGSPILWFTTKVHTEYFTVCLTVIAVAAAIKHRWAAAGAALALASTQNISFALPALVACIVALPLGRAQGDRSSALNICLLSVAAVLALIHPAYYFFRFGILTPQLIAGGTSIDEVNPLRALNFLFDLDVGLLPNWPFGVVLASAGLFSIKWKRTRRDVTLLILLLTYVGSSLLAQSTTTNMNSGATINVSRYGLWYLCLFFPLFLGALCLASKHAKATRTGLMAAALLSLFILNYYSYRPDQYEKYTSPTWASSFAYTHLPSMIKPDMEIFRERNSGVGETPIPRPAVVLGPNCRLALILTGAKREPDVLGARHCGMSQSGLIGLLKRRGAWSDVGSADRYMVLSIHDISSLYPLIERGSVIRASGSPSPMRDFLISGWSIDEPWGVWSDGENAKIGFIIKDSGARNIRISLLMTAFFYGSHNQVAVMPSANGRALPALVIRANDALKMRYEIEIPMRDVVLSHGRIELSFQIKNSRSPQELGISNDRRQLGIGLIEMSVR